MVKPPPVETLPHNFQFSPPTGFEKYFSGKERLPLIGYRDLLPQLKKIELGRFITRLEMYELEPTDNMTRHMLFMEDMQERRTLMFVAQDLNVLDQNNDIYGDLKVIGGTGVYITPDGQSPAQYALDHNFSLALAMRYKTAMAGLRDAYGLSGMKAMVAMKPGEKGLSDWEKSPFLQQATGWLYSPYIFFAP